MYNRLKESYINQCKALDLFFYLKMKLITIIEGQFDFGTGRNRDGMGRIWVGFSET